MRIDGFRIGGYYVCEHTQSEIDRMRHPEIF